MDVVTCPLADNFYGLTHWGRVTHICVGKLTIIGSDNCLSPGRRQAINWTNAEVLLIRPKGTNFSEILNEIRTFSFKKMHLDVSSAKRRPFCLGLNVISEELYRARPCHVLWLSTRTDDITIKIQTNIFFICERYSYCVHFASNITLCQMNFQCISYNQMM